MEPVRRIVDGRRADTVQRLIAASLEEVRAVPYSDVTVRSVAKRADVSPATAYTYFSSKEHLVCAILWQQVQDLPAPQSRPRRSPSASLADAVRDITELFTKDPALSRACTTALLTDDPEVRRLRDQIGSELLRRIGDAIGPMSPAARETLSMAFVGALVLAGTGYMTFEDLPRRLSKMTDLLLADSRTRAKDPKRRSS
ncbi:TetR/AcrR family transcriptional regulator [Amycolatopsis sp. DG1A-15b]|uniref:TetR/AcrR family transcriptional regulator n=1 Tax=Amycolatopsis sp. DG1A-15b TaxID=3052846 RepID=UPI00255BCB1A|nr:TetR/AcrR family transcriptional regulator [Amycolatopsis sp. DG1A-15b]WIX92494.1 TetR/AcrR family transcriptional regulator [Amycolatopsis sp. DG1A-15b]